ncbi:MAG: hypothetical protein IJZ16_07640 [Clostridia bacterium]|nr:hypothetical protein [Clostridia bacterium]
MDIGFYVKKYLNAFVIAGRNYTMYKSVHNRLKANSKTVVLDNKQKNEINDFFSKYGKVTWKFHNFYTEKTGDYYVNYIPDDIYFTKIDKYYNDYQLSKVIDNKCYYAGLFQDFKQPVKLADRKGDYWFVDNQVMPLEQVLDKLCEESAIFIKAATTSSAGGGVRFIDKHSCENYRQKIKQTIAHMNVDIVIQKPIVQHKDLSKLNESSVNTMRLLSVFRNGEVKIYSSLLRIGKANSKVDNGAISVGITPDGKLKEYGYYLTGERVTSHPGSGVVLEGYQLPSFDKAQELVKKAHLCVPHFKMISWDIAIGEDSEPILVEANLSDGEVSFHQLNNGPLFGDDTKEILNEVFGK